MSIASKLFGGLLECLRGCSWSSRTCYAQLSKRMSAKNYLVLHTWYLIYETRYYCCVRVLYLKAPPFATSCSYDSFLNARMGLSPVYSSLISLCKA